MSDFDTLKRISRIRGLFEATAGKPVADCAEQMIDLRMLAKQLADDADRLLERTLEPRVRTRKREPKRVEPTCEECGKVLTVLPDYSGKRRAAVVCFSCDPPRTLCQDCAERHPDHDRGRRPR